VLIKGNEACVPWLQTLIWIRSKEWSLVLVVMQYLSVVTLKNKDVVVRLMRDFSVVNLSIMSCKIT
jgi:hypothetical protein